jgi:hypothetical protein
VHDELYHKTTLHRDKCGKVSVSRGIFITAIIFFIDAVKLSGCFLRQGPQMLQTMAKNVADYGE